MFGRKKSPATGSVSGAVLSAMETALAVITFRPDGAILSANRSYCALLGRTEAELVGRQMNTVLSASEWDGLVHGMIWHRLLRGETQCLTVAPLTRAGEMLYLESTFVPVRNAQGEVDLIVNFVADVTQRMRRFAHDTAVVSAISRSMGVIEFDLDGHITEVNAAFLNTMGYAGQDLIGQHHRMFMPPGAADRPDYAAFWSRLRSGTFTSGEFLRVGSAGQDVWLQASYNPLFDAEGNVCGVIKFATDITLSKTVSLDHAGQLAALDRAQAVIEFDLEGNILFANQNYLDTMGYALDEIVGQHHSIFVHPEERDSAEYASFWASLRAGAFQESEYCRLAKDGRPVWLQAVYNVVLDPAGHPYKVIKFASDITWRKRALAQLEVGVEKLSRGDLTATLDEVMPQEFEELRSNFNQSVQKMGGLVGVIVSGIASIMDEVELLSHGAAELSRRTDLQSTSLEEAAAAITQLSVSVRSSSTNAREAAHAVAQTRQRSDDGASIVHEMIGAMQDIADSSRRISRITAMIDDIAFQTNLLALNAGVEAARAGEMGRGFAVVASEVRALAQRSSEAAQEIKQLIDTSTRQVLRGVDLVDQSGGALTEINLLVQELDGLVQTIASASAEQAASIAEVSSNVHELDRTTQENAALFEDNSTAFRNLLLQSREIADEGAVFQIPAPQRAAMPAKAAPRRALKAG